MRKIGITGGVGCGKSKVLDFLKEDLHARVYQADILAHEVQAPGTECCREVAEQFGELVLRADGSIDREILGSIVFADKEKLLRLNRIVHPAVNRKIEELIKMEEQRGTSLFVLEAALLTEKVYRDMLDEIWYIYAEPDVRRERLRLSRGYTEEKIDAMFASQVSEEVYRDWCDRVIDNSGSFEKTKEEITHALQKENDGRVDS